MRLIAYKTTQESRHMLRYLPEFSCRTSLPELPGFDVYVRPGDPLAKEGTPKQPATAGRGADTADEPRAGNDD
jgi:hypothetical protein